jgi:UPF0755 protein
VLSNQKKIVLALILGIITTLIILSVAVAFWYQKALKNESTVVLIEKGASLSSIATTLADKQVLSCPTLFKAIVLGSLSWRDLKAGEYLIPAHATPAQLIYILKSGDVILHPVTLIEGETSYSFTQKLMSDDRFIGSIDVPAEGSLLPETYHFARGTERKTIIARAKRASEEALNKVWTNRSTECPLKSPQEVVILASIVEKETCLPKERPIVAAVFINRLATGMPLQADPSVLYAISLGKETREKELSLDDLRIESPFNTYINMGLPPSPISNPGLASLRAVTAPAKVPYLYFVADGSGGHVFATSLDEHQKNHERWRKIKKESAETK